MIGSFDEFSVHAENANIATASKKFILMKYILWTFKVSFSGAFLMMLLQI